MFRRVFLLSVVPLLSLQYVRAQSCMVTNLQCEYLANPIGIDNVHPRLTWQMDDANTGSYQKSYQLVVGTDALEVSNGKGNRWQTVQTASAARLVAYNGQALKPFTKYYWRVRVGTNKNDYAVSATASFETGMLSVSHWEGTWISDGEDRSAQPAPYFRKVFQAHKPILSARAYIVAAGLYELYVNGEKIGDHRLSPAYTRYDRRNLYVTYDLTKNMREGHNALGVILGNGWYNFQSIAVWDYERAPWRNRPAFCMDVRITYKDGSEETVRSDKSWKTATGPIVYNSLYTGEHYDARLEQAGWNTTGFDDSKWDGVTVRQAPAENITAESMQPVRHVEGIKPVSMTKRNDSTYLFDLGRNIAGVSRVTLSGRRGTVVRVVHAERLDKNGNPDQSNVDYFLAKGTRGQDPFATDIYTLRGAGAETFMPHFDYKGFQYVEVQADKPISLAQDDLTAYFMHSDVAQVGYIHTSNDLINKIYAATNVSYLSNLVGYPTDCPQREKNGWTGDAHIASETGLYNFDAITLYEKWLRDMRDEQQPNGVLPSIVPTDGWGYEWGNGPDWTSAVAIIPWNVYLFYGDSKILRDNYENIQRYVDHITDLYPTGLTDWGLGDWAPLRSKTPVELTSSIYYYVDVDILAKAAAVLHKNKDHVAYAALAEKIRDAINTKYLNAGKGIYAAGHQTELCVPLFWGIVPDSLRKKVAQNLADTVAANGYHLDVGILGAKAILSALSDNGQAETAYRLAAQKTFPSWGWWIVNGATTLYENWNLDLKRDLSLNHIMFGEIGAWLFKGIGGIKPGADLPGFKHIVFAPHFINSLDTFTAVHTGPYGKIVSSWHRRGAVIDYHVVVPANSTATVHFPGGFIVYDHRKRIVKTSGCRIASGDYTFTLSPVTKPGKDK